MKIVMDVDLNETLMIKSTINLRNHLNTKAQSCHFDKKYSEVKLQFNANFKQIPFPFLNIEINFPIRYLIN